MINSVPRFNGRERFSTPGTQSWSPEYAWLCTVCSSYMTIHIDEENGTMVVVESQTLKCQEFRKTCSKEPIEPLVQ